MNARSTMRAAGGILLLGLLLASNVGCIHIRRASDDCAPAKNECKPACPPKIECLSRSEGDACPPPAASCPQPGVVCPVPCKQNPIVEFREQQPIHVKMPQQTVVVETPHGAPQAPIVPMAPQAPMMPMSPGFSS